MKNITVAPFKTTNVVPITSAHVVTYVAKCPRYLHVSIINALTVFRKLPRGLRLNVCCICFLLPTYTFFHDSNFIFSVCAFRGFN